VPADLVCFAVDIPDSLVGRLDARILPRDWRQTPAPDALRTLGGSWIRRKETVALVVPSAVVPHEHNILLNPTHPDFKRIKIQPPEPFSFDSRMWK
jgi:RES domain-containing protein